MTAVVPAGGSRSDAGPDRHLPGTGLDLADLLDAGALRHAVDRDSASAIAVLSRTDPAGLAAARRRSMATQVWADYDAGDGGSPCGPGSSLEQTAVLRQALPPLLAWHEVRSVVDAPCGDVNWMRHVDLGDVDYLGLDISEALVGVARAALGDRQHRFACLDLMADEVPHADLILCRDLLVHLPFAQALAVLANFEASGSSYLLTTTFTERTENVDIERGGWRPLNLALPPFCLPPPVEIVVEQCTEVGGIFADKSLGLWRLPGLLR